jgi:hypothetical protein
MDTAESLMVRARVAEELAHYADEIAGAGATSRVWWLTDRVAERIASRRSKLVGPYRSLLRVLESDRRPETARLSSDGWIVWEDGNFVVFFDPVTEHFGLAARKFDADIPTFWGVYGNLVHVLCAA